MTDRNGPDAGATDRAFALLQEILPQQLLSRGMHRLARSTRPRVKSAAIRLLLRAYPRIDMREAAEPDPYRYPSFNAFFTRALRGGVRKIAPGPDALVSPVDGTLSQFGNVDAGRLLQAKGIEYTAAALLGGEAAAAPYGGGRYACIYLAPFDYHRIHMPIDGRLLSTQYLPGRLFSVNAATARTIPGLFGINERVVCEFDTRHGALALVMVGALFVGSIETVYAGEINPPAGRRGAPRRISAGEGREFAKGEELGRFNMGSTVVLIWQRAAGEFVPGLPVGTRLRLGQLLAGTSAQP
jgi:phosphatidylserine decarboxylase